jgi:uncharacterized protein (TIGR03435 family)
VPWIAQKRVTDLSYNQSVNSASIAICLAALSAGLGFCQTPPARAEFEVASVKPAPALDTSRAVSFGRQIDGAQVRFTQTSLRDLIRIAWAVRDYQIEAPSWLASARFNVSAKLPDAHTQKQVPEMLQALLADRFDLKVHRASKDLPVYALVVRGAALKIKESPREQTDDQRVNIPEEVKLAGGGGRGGIVDYGGGSYFALPHYRMEVRKLRMDLLAALLGSLTDRLVVDETGLSGRYDFDLELTESDYDAMMIRAAIAIGEAQSPKDLQQLGDAGDPLPRALRRLGLDLKPGKGRVEILVVDDVRKDPTEN